MSGTAEYWYRPGKGPRDLCHPGLSGDALRALTERLVHAPTYQPPSQHLLFAIYRSMGLPRAWQLDVVDDLEPLSPAAKATLREVARQALAELEPGEKYFFIWEPYPNIEPDHMKRMDLTDEEEIEKGHWGWTMPAAFVERIANLSDQAGTDVPTG